MPTHSDHHVSAVCMFATILLLAIPAIARHKAAPPQPTSSPQDVLTYHGDNLRTGWFSSETQLTAGNVNSQSFGLLQAVTLDGRVDAEPLVVMQQPIPGHGIHNVVYVATENNSVYALDADNGSILWQRSFGTPVPYQYKNYDDNVFPVMGILGTPVIDRNAGAMYFVADTYNGTVDTFHLHAISLRNGKICSNLPRSTSPSSCHPARSGPLIPSFTCNVRACSKPTVASTYRLAAMAILSRINPGARFCATIQRP